MATVLKCVCTQCSQVLKATLPFLSAEDITVAASGGRISIDGVSVPLEHRLKFSETLEYWFHRHEPPVMAHTQSCLVDGSYLLFSLLYQVLDTSVELIYVDESVIVVNKPASIPVHPIGRYKVSMATQPFKHTLLTSPRP